MEYKYFYWLYCLILFNHEKNYPIICLWMEWVFLGKRWKNKYFLTKGWKNRYWLYLASTHKKALILKRIRAFSNFAFWKMRSGRDSNPRPHAWQACILTNWTTEPEFLSCNLSRLRCKGRYYFESCNSFAAKIYVG